MAFTLLAAVVATLAAASANMVSAAPASSPAPAPQPYLDAEWPSDICQTAGVDGTMVVNVAYTVESMWNCASKDPEMKLWCTKSTEYAVARYCCGADCDKRDDVPEERNCTVEGKEYIVGRPYKVKLSNGKKGQLWCINETEYRTCIGTQCGSTPGLTPPSPKKAQPTTPPANQPSKYTECTGCTTNGFAWQNNKCTEKCLIQDLACATRPDVCAALEPPAPGSGPSEYKDCASCTGTGFTWQHEARTCTRNCDIMDISCIRDGTMCPPPF